MKKKLKINPKYIIGVVVLLVIAIVGGALGTYIGNQFSAPKEAKAVEVTSHKRTGDEITVPLDEFIINLAKADSGETPYIKIEVSLLTNNPKNEELIKNDIPLIRDAVVNLLRQKQGAEILNEEEGVEVLKEDLRAAINHDYGSELVSEVYITNLVIQ